MIGRFQIRSFFDIVAGRDCSLSGPLWYRLTAVLSHRRHPYFWQLLFNVPVDAIRLNYYVDNLYIKNLKLNLARKRFIVVCKYRCIDITGWPF